MIYTVSDLHGCYDKYQKLLETLNLGENDTLYVLGDVIDRGPKGFHMMLDIASRPNVVCLMGNHEAMAKDALPAILGSLEGNSYFLNHRDRENVSLWFRNGGETSLQDFLRLDKAQRDTVWKQLLSLPLYREVEVGNRKFVLVHGGLEHFSPSRPGIPRPVGRSSEQKVSLTSTVAVFTTMGSWAAYVWTPWKKFISNQKTKKPHPPVRHSKGRILMQKDNHERKMAYAIYLTNGLLYDRLYQLAAEYTLPVERLAELAVERLLQDVEFVRGLRSGKVIGT